MLRFFKNSNKSAIYYSHNYVIYNYVIHNYEIHNYVIIIT